jgi:hypothetical protein
MCEEKTEPNEEEGLKLLKLEKALHLESKESSVEKLHILLKQKQERAKEGLLEP